MEVCPQNLMHIEVHHRAEYGHAWESAICACHLYMCHRKSATELSMYAYGNCKCMCMKVCHLCMGICHRTIGILSPSEELCIKSATAIQTLGHEYVLCECGIAYLPMFLLIQLPGVLQIGVLWQEQTSTQVLVPGNLMCYYITHM